MKPYEIGATLKPNVNYIIAWKFNKQWWSRTIRLTESGALEEHLPEHNEFDNAEFTDIPCILFNRELWETEYANKIQHFTVVNSLIEEQLNEEV